MTQWTTFRIWVTGVRLSFPFPCIDFSGASLQYLLGLIGSNVLDNRFVPLSPAEQLRLPVFFNLPLVPTYLFAPSHVIGYLACVLPAVLRAECVFLLGRAAEFNVPSMRASGASKRFCPLFA